MASMLRNLALVFITLLAGHLPAAAEQQLNLKDSPILPVPERLQLDDRKVDLGEKLFHEPRLSGYGTMACSSCHFINRSGDDERITSITNTGEPDVFNTPTVFNVGLSHHISWQGKFTRLEPQIESALTNPKHMAADWEKLLDFLQNEPEYSRRFAKIYQSSIKRENVLDSIAEYERSLITPNAPFDRWLKGDNSAIDQQAKEGYLLFREIGCIACHQGVNVGGNLFAPHGVFGDPHEDHHHQSSKEDLSRYSITGREKDKRVFRVPSLRNVAETGPWFHDGSAEQLSDAVLEMAQHQLGIKLPDDDVAKITRFLESLTGIYRGKPVGDPK